MRPRRSESKATRKLGCRTLCTVTQPPSPSHSVTLRAARRRSPGSAFPSPRQSVRHGGPGPGQGQHGEDAVVEQLLRVYRRVHWQAGPSAAGPTVTRGFTSTV